MRATSTQHPSPAPALLARHRMIDTISRDDLHAKITRGDEFALFEVLPTMYWRKHHLPGAVSLPPDQVSTLVPQRVPDKDAEIVLYCWDLACPTAKHAARELAALGYTNLRDYEAGKQDWIGAGLPMERR
jgi:rhodanese-related sulfurtransferase